MKAFRASVSVRKCNRKVLLRVVSLERMKNKKLDNNKNSNDRNFVESLLRFVTDTRVHLETGLRLYE